MFIDQFIREKRYLLNVSPATIRWYTHALKWLPNESPSDNELRDTVIRMRSEGLKATGANAAIRAINVYLKWRGLGHIRQLQEPEFIPPMFSADQVQRIVRWKPTTFYDKRLHLLMLILFDNGCRISEALAVKMSDVNLDDLLMTLTGKGRRQRRVPMSIELRRVLCRFTNEKQAAEYLLSSKDGKPLLRNVCLRNVKQVCTRLGFEPPARTLHAFRTTFAIGYLRNGGSVFHLQKILGHRTLEMTRRYANLVTEDLQSVHERFSLLGSAKVSLLSRR